MFDFDWISSAVLPIIMRGADDLGTFGLRHRHRE